MQYSDAFEISERKMKQPKNKLAEREVLWE